MKKLFFILSLGIVFFSSCHDDDKNTNEPQGSTPANYTGIWANVQQQDATNTSTTYFLLLNADGSGALSSTEITFQWKVDKNNNTLWRKLGNEWNDTWKSSIVNDSELTFLENGNTIRLRKITSPNPPEYTGTWKVTKAIQSIGGKWDNTKDVSSQYTGKTIVFSHDGQTTTMLGVTKKWFLDNDKQLIWQYGTDYKLWEAISVIDSPKDGKMSLLVSQYPEFLNLDFEKQ